MDTEKELHQYWEDFKSRNTSKMNDLNSEVSLEAWNLIEDLFSTGKLNKKIFDHPCFFLVTWMVEKLLQEGYEQGQAIELASKQINCFTIPIHDTRNTAIEFLELALTELFTELSDKPVLSKDGFLWTMPYFSSSSSSLGRAIGTESGFVAIKALKEMGVKKLFLKEGTRLSKYSEMVCTASLSLDTFLKESSIEIGSRSKDFLLGLDFSKESDLVKLETFWKTASSLHGLTSGLHVNRSPSGRAIKEKYSKSTEITMWALLDKLSNESLELPSISNDPMLDCFMLFLEDTGVYLSNTDVVNRLMGLGSQAGIAINDGSILRMAILAAILIPYQKVAEKEGVPLEWMLSLKGNSIDELLGDKWLLDFCFSCLDYLMGRKSRDDILSLVHSRLNSPGPKKVVL